jgi:hypothetical protein
MRNYYFIVCVIFHVTRWNVHDFILAGGKDQKGSYDETRHWGGGGGVLSRVVRGGWGRFR